MLLLAIDTSTSAISVALCEGTRVLAADSVIDVRAHSERLTPLIVSVLAAAGATPSDLEAVVAGQGPGPFTGLRVGLVTARVLAWSRGIPAYGVCSLDAIALQALSSLPPAAATQPSAARLLVATDARRKEVYWAGYDVQDGLPVRLEGPGVARAADLPADLRALPCAGRGPLLYPDAFATPLPVLDVDAAALGVLAAHRLEATGSGGAPLPGPDPLYLRRPDAQPSAAKPVSGGSAGAVVVQGST